MSLLPGACHSFPRSLGNKRETILGDKLGVPRTQERKLGRHSEGRHCLHKYKNMRSNPASPCKAQYSGK